MARIRCPKCDMMIPLDDAERGRPVECPECGHNLRLGAGSAGSAEAQAATQPRRDGREAESSGASAGAGGVLIILGVAVGLLALCGGGAALVVFLFWARVDSAPMAPAPAMVMAKDGIGLEKEAAPVALFVPAGVLTTFPEAMPPAATIATDPGTVPVLKFDQGRSLSANRKLGSVAVLPDNERCLTAASDGTVEVWNYRTGQQDRQFTVPNAKPISLTSAPDGNRLLIGCANPQNAKFVTVWDLAAQRELWLSGANKGSYQEVSLSPNGRRVLIRNGDMRAGGGHLMILDLASGDWVGAIQGAEDNRIDRAAWYPNGRQILVARGTSGREAERVAVWDPESGDEVPFMDLRQKGVMSPLEYWAASPAGDRLFLRVGRTGILLSTATTEVLWKVSLQTATRAGVAFSNNGGRVMFWGGAAEDGQLNDCFIHILDVQTGKEICRLESVDPFQSAAFTPDGQGIVAVSRGLTYWQLP